MDFNSPIQKLGFFLFSVIMGANHLWNVESLQFFKNLLLIFSLG